MKLSVLLLGSFEVQLEGRKISDFESHKVRALLAYLAAESGKAVSRSGLAGLLWPDWPDEAANKNLRHSLYSLRKTLQKAGADGEILHSDRNEILLEPGESCWVDEVEFSSRLKAAIAGPYSPEAMHRLAEAAGWLRGPFLDGFVLKDSSDFETWLVSRREHQEQQTLQAWAALADWHARNGEFGDAEAYIHRQIDLEPWREAAHRHLMRIFALQGKRGEALAQYENCRRILRTELDVEPSPETVQLAEQIRSQAFPGPHYPSSHPADLTIDQIDSDSPLKSPSKAVHNLRESISRFVGREGDSAKIKALISQHRLVSLIGSGGVGKTRLALSVASDLIPSFEDGVWLVELAALNEPELILQVVASTFQLRKSQNISLHSTLLEYLRNRRLLLILDNCEHLVEESARLAGRILSQCPRISILVTSRERLDIDGEMVYLVPPMSTPDSSKLLEPAILSGFDSVQLFLDRGRLVRPGFTLTADNAEAVAKICRSLDGIPLALELAAARLQVLNVHQIAQRLDDRFRLLAGSKRGVLAHHQTLLASIEWSHDLLTECEQRLFRRLSVFAGGWALEAAEVVCAGDGLEAFEILDFLVQLTSKSLVDVLVNEDGTQRYRMLETIRAFARNQLAAAGEAVALQQKHLEYYLAFSEARSGRIISLESTRIIDQLDNEVENFRQAIQYGYDEPGQDWSSKGLRLAAALGLYWDMRSRASEGYRWLVNGIAQLASSGCEPAHILAGAYYYAGNLLFFIEDTTDMLGGRSLLEKSIAYAEQAGDLLVQAMAETRLAGYLMNKYIWPSVKAVESAEYAEANRLIDHSLSLAERSQDKMIMAYCLYMKGNLIHYAGDYEHAHQVLESSLAMAQEIGDILTIDAVLLNLGGLLFMQGDPAESTAYYVRGLEHARQIDNNHSIILFLSGLMSSGLLERNYMAMEAWGNEGLRLSLEFGDKRMAVFFLRMLGISYLRRGLIDQAAHHLQASLESAQQLEDEYGTLVYLAMMAGVAVGRSQPERAARLLGAIAPAIQNFYKPFDEHDELEILYITSAGQALSGANEWDCAYQAGLKLSIPQALEEAKELMSLG